MRSNVNPVFVFVVMGIVFVFIAYKAVSALYLDEEFDTHARRTTATVEQAWTTRGSKGSIHYHARYHFLDDQGVRWTDSGPIAPTTYGQLRVGEVVPVKYLNTNPAHSRIAWPVEEQWHWHQDEIMAGVALFMGGVATLIFMSKRRSGQFARAQPPADRF